MSQSRNDIDDNSSTHDDPGATMAKMLEEGRSYSGHERNCCFLNTGGDPRCAGRFANISATSGLDYDDDGRAIALVDWDHDGDWDIWTSNRNAPRLRLMRNDTPNDNHFVTVGLVGNGVTTNRDAVGARIEIVAEDQQGSGSQQAVIRSLRAGEGFLAQSSKVLPIGLGPVERISKIIVRWPDPTRTAEEFVVSDVDRHYELVQGSGAASRVDQQRDELKLKPAVPRRLEATTDARIRLHVLLPVPDLAYEKFDGQQRIMMPSSNPLLVTLWSGTCASCRNELAQIAQQAEQIRAAGINVLALSVDSLIVDGSVAAARQTLEAIDFPFESGLAAPSLVAALQDLHDQLMPLDKPLPIPSSVLIDPLGHLAVIYKGPVSIDKLIEDRDHSADSSLQRYERSSALPGRMTGHEVLNEAIYWQEAAIRSIYAKELARTGFPAKAVAQYKEVLNLRPNYFYAHQNIGRIQAEQGNLPAARQHFEQALRIIPDNADSHASLADVLVREGNLDLAREHCQQAVMLQPESPEFHFNFGSVLLNLRQFPQAREQFELAVKYRDSFTDAWNALGTACFLEGDLVKAQQHYEHAINLKPDYAEAHFNLGNIHARNGNLPEAKTCFETALRHRPNYPEAQANLSRVLGVMQRQPR